MSGFNAGAEPCHSCPATFCGQRGADRGAARERLQAAGVAGIRPDALTGICALLFAAPIATLSALLPLLSEGSAWLQVLAIVSVVSVFGGIARYFRAGLLRWLLIVPNPTAAADPVERLGVAEV